MEIRRTKMETKQIILSIIQFALQACGMYYLLFVVGRKKENRSFQRVNELLTMLYWKSECGIQKKRYKLQYDTVCEFLKTMGYTIQMYENNFVKVIHQNSNTFKIPIKQAEFYIASIYWNMNNKIPKEKYQVQYDILLELLAIMEYRIGKSDYNSQIHIQKYERTK